MEDTQIIALYVSRQETAISETARKYGAYLNQVAYNLLRSREDTEEVLSDTYLAAWNAIPPQLPRALRHFLSRITRNLSLDRLDYRTAARRNCGASVALSELEECIPDRRSDLEEMLENRELGAAINRFLAGLTKADCALFLQRYYYGLTVSELMERHNLGEGAVKYRLGSLRRRLRASLEKEGIAL